MAVKHLMGQLGIAADHVLRHYDIVNKVCPAPYVHNNHYRTSWTWDEFKRRLPDPVTFFRRPRNHGTVSARPGRTPAARSGHLKR